MKLHQFIKNVSETYFSEKDANWSKLSSFWKIIFITLFSFYLLQIQTSYLDSLAIFGFGMGQSR